MSKIQIWKQSTTNCSVIMLKLRMSLICQRYKFESNPQQARWVRDTNQKCRLYVKDTNLKAIHNIYIWEMNLNINVAYMSKIQIWKQSTTHKVNGIESGLMSLICQRYKFESNPQHTLDLFDSSFECRLYVKDTNLKAIHNTGI